MWVATTNFPTAASHPFYTRLNIATELHPNLEEEIRRRAYEIYEKRAGKTAATWKTGSAPKRRSGGQAQKPLRSVLECRGDDWLATQTRQAPAMAKDPYPTSAQLDALVFHMYRAGISYLEALREFKKQFILTVPRDLNWNETKAARALRMHRNTLARTLPQLNLDIRALRKTKRRPLCGVDPPRKRKLAS
jgi:Fis family transcriptional regulator